MNYLVCYTADHLKITRYLLKTFHQIHSISKYKRLYRFFLSDTVHIRLFLIFLYSVLWHSLSLWNFVCGHNSLHPKSHCIWDRFLILIHKTVSYIPILSVLVKEVLSGPGPWLEHVYIYIRICKVRAIFLAGQVGTYVPKYLFFVVFFNLCCALQMRRGT